MLVRFKPWSFCVGTSLSSDAGNGLDLIAGRLQSRPLAKSRLSRRLVAERLWVGHGSVRRSIEFEEDSDVVGHVNVAILWSLEDDRILVVDIALLELSELLPNPLLVLVELEEPDVDVALLHPLDQDDHLLLALNAAGKGADPADLQLPGRWVLQVVDRVAEGHGAEGAVDAVVHPERLDPEHHRVQLVRHLLAQLVGLRLQLQLFSISETDAGRVLFCLPALSV